MSHSREPEPTPSGSNSRLNPMAMDFTPARTSSKRKASSSATSGISLVPSSPPDPAQGQVLIDADDIIGNSPAPSPVRADSAEDWDDFDELEDALFGQGLRDFQGAGGPGFALPMGGGTPAGRQRLRLLQRRAQGASLSYRTSNAARYQLQKPAVLLVQTGSQVESSPGHHDPLPGQLPYLPLCLHSSKPGKVDSGLYTVLPAYANRIRRAAGEVQAAPSVTWPRDRMPVELFELVATHSARDDIKSLRLVNTEFERKTCRSLFRTSVVPFNTELYDMIVDESKTSGRQPTPGYKGKGKGKASATEDQAELAWRNAKDDRTGKLYKGHGLRVFRGFGPYIKRFGMSFEVAENSLAIPPSKQLLDPVDSYHGTYEWPSINYARFAKLNRLEETADETSRMKAAFSNLSIVSELGLSMRNGLGWLEGPDRSFRASLLQHQAAVFGRSAGSKDRSAKSARDILSCLRQGVQRSGHGVSFKELTLEQQALPTPLDKIVGLSGTCFSDTHIWPKVQREVFEAVDSSTGDSCVRPSADGFKVLSANTELTGAAKLGDLDLVPNELKKEQKEWLLETEWAQRAFLESYMLAVVDNPAMCSQVTALNIATISSGLLPMMSRGMFWEALPSLSSVTIHVSPDWRTVDKDEAAYAETKPQNPSDAIRGLHDLLNGQISWRDNITKLKFGWSDGGENAQGMYARNANVLPAPVSLLDQSTAMRPADQLVFPHVEHLTLSNCWITPPMLEGLVNDHATKALKKLTLDSVSLTSSPHPTTHAQQAQAAAAALVNWQAGLQQNNQAGPAAPGLLNVPHGGLTQQQMAFAQQHFQNQMQQMQQLFANNPGAAAQNAFPMAPIGQAFNAFNPPAGLFNANQQGPFGMAPQPPHVNPTYWMNDLRQSCWPDLLNKISPGPIFTDYLPAPQPWEEQRPERPSTSLQTIELISCGYVRLEHNTTFDQTALMAGLDAGRERVMTPWFRARYLALKPYMLDASRDKYLGSIVQWIPQRELDAMRYAWGLRVGWQDREKAEEAEFDGYHPGGTGRVSGVIEKGMPLMTQHLANATPVGQAQALQTPGSNAV